MRLRAQCEIFVWLWRQSHYGNHLVSYWTQLLISALLHTDESKRRRQPSYPLPSPQARMKKTNHNSTPSIPHHLFSLPIFCGREKHSHKDTSHDLDSFLTV
jgi:hypothetical protein